MGRGAGGWTVTWEPQAISAQRGGQAASSVVQGLGFWSRNIQFFSGLSAWFLCEVVRKGVMEQERKTEWESCVVMVT